MLKCKKQIAFAQRINYCVAHYIAQTLFENISYLILSNLYWGLGTHWVVLLPDPTMGGFGSTQRSP